MGFLNSALDRLAAAIGERIQGIQPTAQYSDAALKGGAGSVEAEVCESLAQLVTSGFTMPFEGSSRAVQLDAVSDDFTRCGLARAVAMGMLTGDCIVVPSWNGHGFDNVLVDSSNFAILGANGDELTSVIYRVDKKVMRNTGVTYSLMRKIELVPYTAQDGTRAYATHYKTYIMRNQEMCAKPLSDFPDWAAHNEDEWVVPNTPRLLVGRFKSFALDPRQPNSQKGIPVCFGASRPIREIHYLRDQMHAEFELSEKMVFADRTLFGKRYIRDSAGNIVSAKPVMPKGRERLFMAVDGGDQPTIKEYSPDIRLQPYLDALDAQYREIEKSVGVSSGILSDINGQNYENVDNVRKSMRKTQAFVNAARAEAERMLGALTVCWDTLLNFYGVGAVGEYDFSYKWSDDYINTFTDQLNAIVAGQSFGGADAVDYRMHVFGESPEVAAQRVEAIGKSRGIEALLSGE